MCCREVVERRVYTVTGAKASADEVDRMIETGESESIFQKAILEQGRGHVRTIHLLESHCYEEHDEYSILPSNGASV